MDVTHRHRHASSKDTLHQNRVSAPPSTPILQHIRHAPNSSPRRNKRDVRDIDRYLALAIGRDPGKLEHVVVASAVEEADFLRVGEGGHDGRGACVGFGSCGASGGFVVAIPEISAGGAA